MWRRPVLDRSKGLSWVLCWSLVSFENQEKIGHAFFRLKENFHPFSLHSSPSTDVVKYKSIEGRREGCRNPSFMRSHSFRCRRRVGVLAWHTRLTPFRLATVSLPQIGRNATHIARGGRVPAHPQSAGIRYNATPLRLFTKCLNSGI